MKWMSHLSGETGKANEFRMKFKARFRSSKARRRVISGEGLVAVCLVLAALVACSDGRRPGPAGEAVESITVEGPALVMFYTDN